MNHDGIPVFGLYADTLNQVTVSYKLDGKPVTENYRIQTSGIDFPVADMSIRPHPEAEVVVNTGKMNGSLYLINSLYPGMTDEMIDYMAKTITEAVNQ